MYTVDTNSLLYFIGMRPMPSPDWFEYENNYNRENFTKNLHNTKGKDRRNHKNHR